jgi:CRISPR-associated protein Csm3
MVEIGGLDNPIIRHPLTELPYVPGSSLKGKMRSLLELRHNKIDASGEVHVCDDPDCLICRIFGSSADTGKIGPGRLIVRDAGLTGDEEDEGGDVVEGWKTRIQRLREAGETGTEIKYENTINRITARANPRQMERVPAGVEFAFEIGYRIFSVDGDDGKRDLELFEHVIEGLQLVQADALGGSGSRGYGKVAFDDLTLTDIEGEISVQAETLDELRQKLSESLQ